MNQDQWIVFFMKWLIFFILIALGADKLSIKYVNKEAYEMRQEKNECDNVNNILISPIAKFECDNKCYF